MKKRLIYSLTSPWYSLLYILMQHRDQWSIFQSYLKERWYYQSLFYSQARSFGVINTHRKYQFWMHSWDGPDTVFQQIITFSALQFFRGQLHMQQYTLNTSVRQTSASWKSRKCGEKYPAATCNIFILWTPCNELGGRDRNNFSGQILLHKLQSCPLPCSWHNFQPLKLTKWNGSRTTFTVLLQLLCKTRKGLCFRKGLQLYHQWWHRATELQRAVYGLAEQMQFCKGFSKGVMGMVNSERHQVKKKHVATECRKK